VETILPARKVFIGGGWNVTLAVQDRENYIEKQIALAQQISALTSKPKVMDIWGRLHPDSKQNTYRGNKTVQKSRLYRMVCF
jgi:hypothetical protein